MLYHSTHSYSRLFVPWVGSVALNTSSQVQLAYWGLFHSSGGLAGENMRSRQAGEGAEGRAAPSACVPCDLQFTGERWGQELSLSFFWLVYCHICSNEVSCWTADGSICSIMQPLYYNDGQWHFVSLCCQYFHCDAWHKQTGFISIWWEAVCITEAIIWMLVLVPFVAQPCIQLLHNKASTGWKVDHISPLYQQICQG